eukprot:6559356-Heterocapsa_arctica.AAC.1
MRRASGMQTEERKRGGGEPAHRGRQRAEQGTQVEGRGLLEGGVQLAEERVRSLGRGRKPEYG